LDPQQPIAIAPGLRLFVQGDFNHLSDFVDALREDLGTRGLTFDMVERGAAYDYNVVFMQSGVETAAIVLDQFGTVAASVVHHGNLTATGSTKKCARELGKRVAALRAGRP
jgi:hypothetical protein